VLCNPAIARYPKSYFISIHTATGSTTDANQDFSRIGTKLSNSWCPVNDDWTQDTFFWAQLLDTVHPKTGHRRLARMPAARYTVNMALITRENAVAMGKLSAVRRKEAKEREEREKNGLPPITAGADEQRLCERVRKQIEKCDELLDRCRSPRTFVQLTSAKERLWNLIYPKAGSIRPGKSRRQDRAPIAPIQPLPIEPTPALVAPPAGEIHKTEIIQS
jgi:hypothetical protein